MSDSSVAALYTPMRRSRHWKHSLQWVACVCESKVWLHETELGSRWPWPEAFNYATTSVFMFHRKGTFYREGPPCNDREQGCKPGDSFRMIGPARRCVEEIVYPCEVQASDALFVHEESITSECHRYGKSNASIQEGLGALRLLSTTKALQIGAELIVAHPSWVFLLEGCHKSLLSSRSAALRLMTHETDTVI